MAQNETVASYGSYIVVSPVKDEEQYLERTIRSVLRQTVKPRKWVIVDDGSADRTRQIIDDYAREHEWLLPLTIRRDAVRRPGSAEIRAFQEGFELIQNEPFEFVVKLDGDLDLPEDYFERLLARFRADDRLGIASGAYLEDHGGSWQMVKMPAYHASGASKVVRRQCFFDIGGFPLFPGWDTADEIKAHAHGWRSAHFPEIQFQHLRPEGSAVGTLRTSRLHGEMYYACGGGPGFLVLKTAHRFVFGRPFFFAGCALLYGYLRAWIRRAPKLVTRREAESYRSLLNSRLNPLHRAAVKPRCD